MDEPGEQEAQSRSAGPKPDLSEALRELGATGRAGLGAASDAAKALRILVSADISLARSAFGRTLAFTGIAIAFGTAAWLLVVATLTTLMQRWFGWSWALSIGLSALASIAITVYAGWQAMQYFEHTRLQATRRQLARLGIGELEDLMPKPDSPVSAREATEALPDGGEPIKKGLGVDVTPP